MFRVWKAEPRLTWELLTPMLSSYSYAVSPAVLENLGDRIFAVAMFDSNGILESSEFRENRHTPYWTEAVFSAISFKGLLDSALNHCSFRHAKIRGERHVAFLIRRRRRYIALLSDPLDSWEEEIQMRHYLREMGTGALLELIRHPVDPAAS